MQAPTTAPPPHTAPPHTAAIVLVGNELLSGKLRDENGAYALAVLRSLGVETRRLEVVPDEEEAIVDAVRRCRRVARHLITSGGIGTTHDDVTVPAIAKALGRDLAHAPEIVALLRARWGDDLHPYRIRLAEIPQGGEVLWGERRELAFPAIACEGVLILPGVPQLFREKLDALKERYRAPPIVLANLYLTCGEGEIAGLLTEATRLFPGVAIGSYPRFDDADHRVKVTVESREAALVAACRDHLARETGAWLLRES
jgi:molybdenum cofactor synthesis domain-containing protein